MWGKAKRGWRGEGGQGQGRGTRWGTRSASHVACALKPYLPFTLPALFIGIYAATRFTLPPSLCVRGTLTLSPTLIVCRSLTQSSSVTREAVRAAEQDGIVFIDEIDKIVEGRGGGRLSGSVSSEGVQRDLLPIIEGEAGGRWDEGA